MFHSKYGGLARRASDYSRVTQDELLRIEHDAAAYGLSVGGYLRWLALDNPQTRPARRPLADVQLLIQIKGQVGRLGGNLHQLLRLAIQNAEKWRDIRAESTTKGRGGAREMGDAGGALAGAKMTGRIATKAFDTVADLFEAIFAAPTPEQAAQAEATRVQREAEQAAQAQREQQERQSERQMGRDR